MVYSSCVICLTLEEEAALRWAEQQGIHESSPVYASLLQKCCRTKCLHLGKLIHSHIRKAGHSNDPHLAHFLLRMYGECGCVEDARSVYDQLPDRSVFTGNLMLAAYARNGHLQDAKLLFDEMPCKSTVTWNSLIAAYARAGYPLEALHIFHRMNLEGARLNAVTLMSAIDACSSGQLFSEGVSLHAVAVVSGYLFDSTEVGNALIKMYGKYSRVDASERVFRTMKYRDFITWNTLISAYAQNGRMSEARRVFNEIPRKDIVTWNTMITAYSQAGNGEMALATLALLDMEGLRPTSHTYISALDACGKVRALNIGKMLHSEVARSVHELEVSNSLINMYGRCACPVEAEEALSEMRCEKNVITWTSLLAAYVHAGDLNGAFQALYRMDLEGVQPNETTFVSVLNACVHAGALKRGWEVFVSMGYDYGLTVRLDHVVCIVDLLGRAGLVSEAEKLVRASGFGECSAAWMALLSACRNNNVPSSRVHQQALELNLAKSSPYLLISNTLEVSN